VRQQRDDAQYECVAENGVGDAVAADAVLKVTDSKYQEFLYFPFLFLYNLSPVMILLGHVVDPKHCSTENCIRGCAMCWTRTLPIVYLTGELNVAAVFLPVLWPLQLENALPSTDVGIFGNSSTFFCPL
jgi:hypothetical protein